MGKDREIKVSQQLEKYLFTLGVVKPQSSIKGVPPAERASELTVVLSLKFLSI